MTDQKRAIGGDHQSQINDIIEARDAKVRSLTERLAEMTEIAESFKEQIEKKIMAGTWLGGGPLEGEDTDIPCSGCGSYVYAECKCLAERDAAISRVQTIIGGWRREVERRQALQIHGPHLDALLVVETIEAALTGRPLLCGAMHPTNSSVLACQLPAGHAVKQHWSTTSCAGGEVSWAERCTATLGSRPYWMSPDQYDPCRCTLIAGHDGEHACEHTKGDGS